jgi:hypothetical protein
MRHNEGCTRVCVAVRIAGFVFNDLSFLLHAGDALSNIVLISEFAKIWARNFVKTSLARLGGYRKLGVGELCREFSHSNM